MDENENDYITTGAWNSTGITLTFNIPLEDKGNPYTFYPLHNISRKLTYDNIEQDVNVILIVFKRERANGSPIRANANEQYYSKNFNLTEFITSENTPKLDSKNDSLIIFFHDDNFEEKFLNHFLENTPNYYKRAENSLTKHFAITILEPLIPRRAGMSIVRKS